VKRMLAYSSVSHAGFLLIAIAANNESGGEALLYYLIPYSAATVGAFAVVAAREREQGRAVTLSSLEGLGWERPFLGVAMWAFVLSMAGFPLTGGFLGKLFVFSAAYEAGWWWLVVAGVLATALSLAYYLNIVRALFMRGGDTLPEGVVAAGGSPRRDLLLDTAVGAAIVVTIGSFFFVQPLVDLAQDAVASLPL
jgi:NADH-quinone oxidoreductase subunit N